MIKKNKIIGFDDSPESLKLAEKISTKDRHPAGSATRTNSTEKKSPLTRRGRLARTGAALALTSTLAIKLLGGGSEAQQLPEQTETVAEQDGTSYPVEPGDMKSKLVVKYVPQEKIEENGVKFYENQIIDHSDPHLLQADENVTLTGDVEDGYLRDQRQSSTIKSQVQK